MIALYLTIFISLLLAIVFLIFFFHSVKSGQYEDAYSPSVRMLYDDDMEADSEVREKEEHIKTKNNSK